MSTSDYMTCSVNEVCDILYHNRIIEKGEFYLNQLHGEERQNVIKEIIACGKKYRDRAFVIVLQKYNREHPDAFHD